VLDGVDLDVAPGTSMVVIGGSGSGKSVLLKCVLGLIEPDEGTIEIDGKNLLAMDRGDREATRAHIGMLFQNGALFSSLTVLENLQFPVREYLDLSQRLLDELAIAKLEMVGLGPDVGYKYPSELSGGMIKRVALARALALDPEILFLDEPTSGLDPISAGEFDQLILTLQETLGVSIFMVTHDLDSLHRTCDRIAVLGDGKIIEAGTMYQMLGSNHPWLKSYFHGARAHDDWHVEVKG
jgi:phospholipid/cholesterol/gamma-HCH transport system ATP-binding protein